MRFYTKIKTILIFGESVWRVELQPLNRSINRYDYDMIINEHYTNKEDVVIDSGDVVIIGEGKFAGKILMQMPVAVVRRIKVAMRPYDATHVVHHKPKISERIRANWQNQEYRDKIANSRKIKRQI